MNKLVIASNNAGKLKEIQRVLAPLNWEVLAQSAFNIPEAEEPHHTFIENALAKARHASKLSGLPALADDSGICVDALGGAPGVYSAHYAGMPKSDARNNQALLDAMKSHSNRQAHYYCVLVMVRHGDDPQPIIAEGSWNGEIAREPRGEGGFGYDPLFFLPDLNKMSAELSHDEKNKISHRGLALAALIEKITLSF
jgi:XTP/dITP diphosphohydrolase